MNENVKKIIMNENYVEKVTRIIDTNTDDRLTPSMVANIALQEIDPDGVTPKLVREAALMELDKVAEVVLYRNNMLGKTVELPDEDDELWDELFWVPLRFTRRR